MTCKECIHFELCSAMGEDIFGNKWKDKVEDVCDHFDDRTKFIKLPCKVGDTVYYIPFGNNITESKVAQITIEPIEEIGVSFLCYGGISFDLRFIGKSVFLTREEAERAIEERSKR